MLIQNKYLTIKYFLKWQPFNIINNIFSFHNNEKFVNTETELPGLLGIKEYTENIRITQSIM